MKIFSFPFIKLWFMHVVILVISNYAVQIPLTVFGIHTTLGTFTYPFIFLTTDLTVRIFGQTLARKVVFSAFIPGLIISYVVGTIFEHGDYQGLNNLMVLSIFVLRISLASLGAYASGQICDIFVFQKLRNLPKWWPAPAASAIFGNLIDTYVFFAIAFIGTTDAFMAEHWFEIASVDYIVKLSANIILFVPAYGIILRYLKAHVLTRMNVQNCEASNL